MEGRVGTCRNFETMDILPTLRYFSDSPHFNPFTSKGSPFDE